MKIMKNISIIFSVFSIIFILLIDYFDISQFIDYSIHLDSTISNTITFISILLGFISSIYVMIQQTQESYVLNLLRKHNLMRKFNESFKTLMYLGFINVFILIFMNLVASNHLLFKITLYIALPTTIYFLISSADIIITICKMILAEEELKSRNKILEDSDIRIK